MMNSGEDGNKPTAVGDPSVGSPSEDVYQLMGEVARIEREHSELTNENEHRGAGRLWKREMKPVIAKLDALDSDWRDRWDEWRQTAAAT